FKGSGKDQRADRTRNLCRHANEPRKPILLHVLFAHHFPGVDEDSHLKFFTRLKKIEKLWLAKIYLGHICTDLNPFQTDLFAAFKFRDREFRILQRNCSDADESQWKFSS